MRRDYQGVNGVELLSIQILLVLNDHKTFLFQQSFLESGCFLVSVSFWEFLDEIVS